MTEHRASIEERIAWTTRFTSAADKLVLLALARSADFDTGKHAHPSLKTLVARTGLSKRSVYRSLRRLKAEGWIKASPSHRHATTYDLNLDKLAKHGPVRVPSPRSRFSAIFLGCQIGTQILKGWILGANLALRSIGAAFGDHLSANLARLGAKLAPLPVIRTRIRKSARARAIPVEQHLPGLIGPARSPPVTLTPPARGPTSRGGVPGNLNCPHEPRCHTIPMCVERLLAEGRAEREQKHG